MTKKIITLCLLIMASTVSLSAQKLKWSIDFSTVFDNREGNYTYAPNQTIFFTRLAPEIGLSLCDDTHIIKGGVTWNQPIGNGWKQYKLVPTIYYHYNTPSLRFSIGQFARTQLMEESPKFLWSDSIGYQQPNIRGVLLQYVKPTGYAELAVDWRQMQTETQREAFNVNFNGRWRPRGGIFMLGGHLQYNHLAKQKNAPEGQGVNDDITINPFVGLDLSHRTALDSLTIEAGAILQLERSRVLGSGFRTPKGAMLTAVAEWRWLGIKETLYAGDNLFPLYPTFGSQLNMGDPMFQSKLYSRTDVYAIIFRKSFIDMRAALNFHVTKAGFTFWQQLSVRLYFSK